MNISTSDLFESFVRKFSIGQNGRTRFLQAFLSSYNDAIFDLYNDGQTDEPTLLASVGDDAEMDIRFLPQIKIGIKHFLQSEAEWVKGEPRDHSSHLNWEKAKTVWQEVATLAGETAGTSTYPWGE